MSKQKKTKADWMATLSLILGFISMPLDLFFVGIIFGIASVVLAILALKDGNFTDYSDGEGDTFSHRFRAFCGIGLSVVGVIILVVAGLNG